MYPGCAAVHPVADGIVVVVVVLEVVVLEVVELGRVVDVGGVVVGGVVVVGTGFFAALTWVRGRASGLSTSIAWHRAKGPVTLPHTDCPCTWAWALWAAPMDAAPATSPRPTMTTTVATARRRSIDASHARRSVGRHELSDVPAQERS